MFADTEAAVSIKKKKNTLTLDADSHRELRSSITHIRSSTCRSYAVGLISGVAERSYVHVIYGACLPVARGLFPNAMHRKLDRFLSLNLRLSS